MAVVEIPLNTLDARVDARPAGSGASGPRRCVDSTWPRIAIQPSWTSRIVAARLGSKAAASACHFASCSKITGPR